MSRKPILIVLSFVLLLASSSWLLAPGAFAQSVPISVGGLDLSLSTANPTPGQKETVTARSYSIDINSATVTWTIAGKVVQKGVGLTTLDIKAPALGKNMVVSVSAVTPGGTSVSSSIIIQTGSVDMIIESDGYVPPFFKGKLSPAYQNMVTIVAIPHLANSSGTEYDPRTLVYSWKRNDQVIEDQSGYGKQAITLPGDSVPRAYTLTVSVTTRDGSAQASGYLPVSFDAPMISFYIDDPLYGPLYNQAVGDTVRIGSQKETSVIAAPFGFNKPVDNLGHLSLSWLVNGQSRPELSSSDSVILRAPDSASGNSTIELDIQNSKEFLQGTKGGFTATFTNTATQ